MNKFLDQIAYEAYCEQQEWKSFRGEPLPQWADVKPEIKKAWQVASSAAGKYAISQVIGALRSALNEIETEMKNL